MPDRILVTCEHASNAIPPDWRDRLQPFVDGIEEHRIWDPGTPRIARALAKTLDTACFEGRWTRLLVDLNRSPHHRQLHAPPIARRPRKERLDLIRLYHRPWRETVHQAIEATTRGGSRVIHLSVHSFTPVMNGVDRRTDFALLYDPKRSAEKGLAQRWLNTIRLEKPSWRLRSNFPYRGTADGHVTALRKHFSPEQYIGIEMEFSQGLPLIREGAELGRMIAKCLLEALNR